MAMHSGRAFEAGLVKRPAPTATEVLNVPESRLVIYTANAHVTVVLAVTLSSVPDPNEAVELVRAAHRVCPYSNATRGNVDVSLTANGRAVDDAATPLTA
jgi:organic hydroperoxide reductase OsmC/OhrA